MLAALLIFVIIASDQLTKMWIADNFVLYESKAIVPGFFNLTFITNQGAAFGFLNGDYGPWRHVFFIVVAIVALFFLVVAFKQFKDESKLFGVAICMIAAGAIGNLIDRIRMGAVIDFLDFYIKGYHWPAFNVADSAITVGVVLFMAGHLFSVKHHTDVDK